MADNSTLPATGDIIAADEISGVKHQRVKVEFGTDGSATEVSSTNPLPVTVGSIAMPTTFVHGQKLVATPGTELVLGSSATLLNGVTVKALHSNTGLVYVGGNPVTSSTGFPLAAGESVFIVTDNITDVYVDCVASGGLEGVAYIGS